MRVPEIREYNTHDWLLVGGAEKFDDGCEPFIADNFEYADIMTIADKNGLQVVTTEGEYTLPIGQYWWRSDTAEEFLRVFVASLAKLTDDEVIHYCRKLGFITQAKVCPVCGRKYKGYPAISRKDNKTEICPDCGVQEAIDDFFKR